MLALKLLLVPAFLLLVSLAAKRWGPSTAGWLAGLPLVAGPTLFFIALEQGAQFGAQVSLASLSAVPAVVAFSIAYANSARRMSWPWSLLLALLVWAGASACLSVVPFSILYAFAASIIMLVVAPRLFPRTPVALQAHAASRIELGCRMVAGAFVTVGVSWIASTVGEVWSGLIAVFPTLGTVLASFSHRAHGGAYAAALLRAMVTGMYSFTAFCLALAVALPYLGVGGAFALAIVASLSAQLVSKTMLSSSVMFRRQRADQPSDRA